MEGTATTGPWYHTIELPSGEVTPGLFDHRPVLQKYGLPPKLEGKRVLDVGTFDGFFAFEFERRGAAEVVALDVPEPGAMDWPTPLRRTGTGMARSYDNFDVAHSALGSRVTRERLPVYEASTERLGTFDLIFVGSLLVHLRDPVGALMALHEICAGELWLADAVSRTLDIVGRGRPLAQMRGASGKLEWWLPNRAALRDCMDAAGFVDIHAGPRFTVPFRAQRGGIAHAVLRGRPGGPVSP